MNIPVDFEWALPFALYAETHYRFPFFFSLLKKSEPELVADAPHRVEPRQPIPILLIGKDANRFPCVLKQVEVTFQQNSRHVSSVKLLREPIELNEPLWWKVWKLQRPPISGWVDCNVSMIIERQGATETYHNDNYKTSSRSPLRIFLSSDSLPRLPRLYLGDVHTHSSFTSDQVEFGSPLEASMELSKPMGLHFFCVTDHSYDLDDSVDSYLRNDPTLPKWQKFIGVVKRINLKQKDFVIVPGEEVSARNGRDQNVHLLLYGNGRFFHGSGDSAERWLRTRSEHSVQDILRQRRPESITVAAHPKDPVPFLQRLLLGRGLWTHQDLRADGLNGIQFANGIIDHGFQVGYREWKTLLLTGKRLFIFAGNDAHGNFNRFRQIGIPFFKIVERNSQIFGRMRTGAFIEKQLSQPALLESLAKGRTVVTDGPVLNLKKQGERSSTSIGGSYKGKSIRMRVVASSSKEFGTIQRVNVFFGEIGAQSETEIHTCMEAGYEYVASVDVRVHKAGYIRAEVLTSPENDSDQQHHFCYTNPLWLSP